MKICAILMTMAAKLLSPRHRIMQGQVRTEEGMRRLLAVTSV
jgi:hypothetical protein